MRDVDSGNSGHCPSGSEVPAYEPKVVSGIGRLFGLKLEQIHFLILHKDDPKMRCPVIGLKPSKQEARVNHFPRISVEDNKFFNFPISISNVTEHILSIYPWCSSHLGHYTQNDYGVNVRLEGL